MKTSCGFSKNLIKALVCQKDISPLEMGETENADNEEIFKGYLKCTRCGLNYRIDEGILNMMEKNDNVEELALAEIEARDKQAGDYDKRMMERYDREIPSTFKNLGDLHGKKMIEYGCGTGRFTVAIAGKCEQVLAIDFSLNSLRILSKKLKQNKNVGLILANASRLKVAPHYFDLAFSAQLFEHIPRLNQRADFLENMKKTLKDRGLVVCSCYHYSLVRKLRKQPQEGCHSSGIFFHFFSYKEIKEEFGKYFKIISLRPIDIALPFTRGRFSVILEKIPFLNKFGHLLIVKAEKI